MSKEVKKRTILLCTDVMFWNLSRGNETRIHTMVTFFIKCGFQVIVIGVYKLKSIDRQRIKIYGKGLKVIEMSKYSIPYQNKEPLYKFQEIITKRINKFKKSIGLIQSHNLLSDYFSYKHLFIFQHLCRVEKPAIILVEYIYFGYLVGMSRNYIPNKCKLVIDTHDVMYQRYESFKEYNQKTVFYTTKYQEKKILSIFDIIIAINQNDAKSFKRMLPNKTIITVPHTQEVKKLSMNKSNKPISLMYIAGSGTSNVHAINEFLEQVWVKLFKKYQDDIQLNIYGQVSTKILKQFIGLGINLVGFVEKLEQIYTENHITINPVLIGSGLKIKNVEALCYGKPLVTTSIGAQGIEKGANKAFFVCDTYEKTYQIICKLIDSEELRDEISNHAYQFALNNFTEDRAFSQLLRILRNK